MPPLPLTRTRLSASLQLLVAHQTDESGSPINFSSFPRTLLGAAEFASSLKYVGSTSVFRVSQTSTNYKGRGINSPREPFRVSPMTIETSIEMERALLYNEDGMSGFKFMPGNIAFQTRPLIFIELVTSPADGRDPLSASDAASFQRMALERVTSAFTSEEAKPITYLYCWVRESKISYDMKSSNQAVMQTMSFDVGRVVLPLSLVPVIGEPATRILAGATSLISSVTKIGGRLF